MQTTMSRTAQRTQAPASRAAAVPRAAHPARAPAQLQRAATPVVAPAPASRASRAAELQRSLVPAAATLDKAAAPSSSSAATTNQKPTVIITGASSGLGLNAAAELAKSGDWHVVMACRDFSKAEAAAKRLGMPKGSFTVMHLDLASMNSVRRFVESFKAAGLRLDALVCNAAVYLPTAKEPTFTADGFELSVQTNHLGHFLLVRLLMDDLAKAPNGKPRCVIVGSITGNTNTLAGNVPPKADLGDLAGLEAAFSSSQSASMIDGKEFDGAKAYKDSKVCNMLTMRELNKRYHDSTGITFASLYPGCIAETGLFRNHVPLFRKLFPAFQKYVTKGYVSEEEAGRRLAQVVSDPSMQKSGVYWSWNSTSGGFENQVSEEVSDDFKAARLYEVTEKLVGLA